MGAPVVGVRARAHDVVVGRSGARRLEGATARLLIVSKTVDRDLGADLTFEVRDRVKHACGCWDHLFIEVDEQRAAGRP